MHTTNPPCSRMLTFRPPRIATLLVAIAAALQWTDPGVLPELPGSAAAAVLLALAGWSLMVRAWWLFRKADTGICPTGKARKLITNDVYMWTRYPMYLGIVMMMSSVGMATGSLYHFLAAGVFFAIIDHSFCPYEEENLSRLFGDAFRKYRVQTRRWL